MSLRLRLGLWYATLNCLIMLVGCVLIYAIYSRSQYDDLDRALVGTAEHAADEYAMVAPANRPAALAISTAPNIALRVYDLDGLQLAATATGAPAPSVDPRAVLRQSAGRPYDPLVALTPSLVALDRRDRAFGLAPGPGDQRWRIYVLPVIGADAYLVAAAPLAGIDESVARLRWLLITLAGLGAAATFFISRLIANRVLQTVALLTTTAGTIARTQSFDQRIPVDPHRDELGRLAATFNEMLASLARAHQTQQRFIADASHELRAPLTAIEANLELLERLPDMAPAERREATVEASREARRLARLVADLLALARADAGVLLRRQRVELDRVVLDALGEARHLARGQRLTVEQLEPLVVDGDPDRLRQLLLILLDNALKYTPPEGQVTLGLRRDGATAEVFVRDTGSGIPPDDLSHVFERFYRADPGRARDPGGTGLGLPIARWIAEQHGGRITLDSAPGCGTTATIQFPILV